MFGMKLTNRLLMPDLWPALEDLFGEKSLCSRCWCMYWPGSAPAILSGFPRKARGYDEVAE